MEFSIQLEDVDDSRDLFLLAKDRLLDVNEWDRLIAATDFSVTLTNSRGEKVHRDARMGDMIQISARNGNGISSAMWVRVEKLQYDFFPDNSSESISMLLKMSFSPSGNGIDISSANETEETILISRYNDTVTAHCNAGNELPHPDDNAPDEHINRDIDLHPVLSIPRQQLENLLKGFISVNVVPGYTNYMAIG